MQNAIIILSFLLVIVGIAAVLLIAYYRGECAELKTKLAAQSSFGGEVGDANILLSGKLKSAVDANANLGIEKQQLESCAAELSDELQHAAAENEKLTVRVTALETIRTALEAREREATDEIRKLKSVKPLPPFKRHAKKRK